MRAGAAFSFLCGAGRGGGSDAPTLRRQAAAATAGDGAFAFASALRAASVCSHGRRLRECLDDPLYHFNMRRMTIDTKLQTKSIAMGCPPSTPFAGHTDLVGHSVSVVPGHDQPTERIDRGSPHHAATMKALAALLAASGGRRLLLGPALCQGHDLQETHRPSRPATRNTGASWRARVHLFGAPKACTCDPTIVAREANFSLAKTHVSQHMRSVYAGACLLQRIWRSASTGARAMGAPPRLLPMECSRRRPPSGGRRCPNRCM